MLTNEGTLSQSAYEIGVAQEKAPAIPGYKLELDGIRGMAASMVLFYHGSSIISQHWLDSVYARVMAFCHSGVDLFFVLSGYLITSILYRDIKKNNPPHFFYARRILRIVPLLFLLISVLALGPVLFTNWPLKKIPRGEVLASLLFISNFKMGFLSYYFNNFLGCTWSVSLEEQFYLFWPSLVRKMSREVLLRFCLLAIVSALALRTILVFNQVSHIFINVMFFTRFDALAFGAVIYLLFERLNKNRYANFWAYFILFLGLGVIFLMEFYERARYPCFGSSIGYTIFGLTYSALLFLVLNAHENSAIRNLFRNSIFTFPGKLCYGVYLLHGPVIGFYREYVFNNFPWEKFDILPLSLPLDCFRLITLLGTTILVSTVVFYLFERPFLKIQRYFR